MQRIFFFDNVTASLKDYSASEFNINVTASLKDYSASEFNINGNTYTIGTLPKK